MIIMRYEMITPMTVIMKNRLSIKFSFQSKLDWSISDATPSSAKLAKEAQGQTLYCRREPKEEWHF